MKALVLSSRRRRLGRPSSSCWCGFLCCPRCRKCSNKSSTFFSSSNCFGGGGGGWTQRRSSKFRRETESLAAALFTPPSSARESLVNCAPFSTRNALVVWNGRLALALLGILFFHSAKSDDQGIFRDFSYICHVVRAQTVHQNNWTGPFYFVSWWWESESLRFYK